GGGNHQGRQEHLQGVLTPPASRPAKNRSQGTEHDQRLGGVRLCDAVALREPLATVCRLLPLPLLAGGGWEGVRACDTAASVRVLGCSALVARHTWQSNARPHPSPALPCRQG